MKKINILSKQTSQLIAAGEVVERPASVIKELLENSIDAGSTRITIEIKNGGNKLIKISDNGSGIYREDVKNAFLRHATSKLKNSDDLENIVSLGFRGEALASICAVSHVELITKSSEEEVGTQFFIDGGVPGKLLDIGCTDGTTILVKDLFYNTPARMKFLKKDVSEANACAGIIDKLALSHPEISFKFIRDGKEVLRTTGDGKVSSAVYCVYGKDFFGGMIPVDYEYGGIKLSGYVCKPIFSKSSRNMQNFFLNGRYIKTKIGSSALEEAFKNSVMVGKFPYCVLYLSIAPGCVDVNVHPTKSEVKFSDEKSIFEVIYYGVKTALMNYSNEKAILNSNNFSPEISSFGLSDSSKNDNFAVKKEEENKQIEKVTSETASQINFSGVKTHAIPLDKKSEQSKVFNAIEEKKKEPLTPDYFEKIFDFEITKNSEKEKTDPHTFKEEVYAQEQFVPEKEAFEARIIGEVLNCYIIIELKDEIVLVDKHAAHERIIFEKLKSSVSLKEAQSLIEPIVVTLEKEQFDAIINNLEYLSEVGIDAEDFGAGSIIVRSVPMYMEISEVENSIIEISEYLIKNLKSIDTQKLDWLYHNIACRSAIKGGQKTSKEEICELVKKLSQNPDIQHCPHGRPIYVTFTKKFIEKQFGRT